MWCMKSTTRSRSLLLHLLPVLLRAVHGPALAGGDHKQRDDAEKRENQERKHWRGELWRDARPQAIAECGVFLIGRDARPGASAGGR